LAKLGRSAEHMKFRNFFAMLYSNARSGDGFHPGALHDFIRSIPFPEEILVRETADLGPLQWWLPGIVETILKSLHTLNTIISCQELLRAVHLGTNLPVVQLRLKVQSVRLFPIRIPVRALLLKESSASQSKQES
jgi:hypothetical protein